MTTRLAQDPDELFDIVTADGEPTGIVKRRADVHRDGDWHRAIHVWVYGSDESGPYLLMNQRGRHKDTWPLALDATVGGHLGAGETIEDAYREVEEEIGIRIQAEMLRYIGKRARESHGDIPGIIDREIQEVFLLHDDRPLAGFRPNPTELEGLVQLSLTDAMALVSGKVDHVKSMRLRAENLKIEPFEAKSDSLVLMPGDDYFAQVAHAITQVIEGISTVKL